MHDPHSERMSGSETRAASGLALVFAFRMLGMFMVLPVLATYGMDLAERPGPDRPGDWRLRPDPGDFPDSVRDHFRPHRPPPGDLSRVDVFALGSVLAANADSIWGVIAGRILQGAGRFPRRSWRCCPT
jgi:hypothetical protein